MSQERVATHGCASKRATFILVYAIDAYTPLAYYLPVIFVETPVFTSCVNELLDDEAYGELQGYLAEHPEAGDVISETGGLRKLRWSARGKGKRGGVRIIYYYVTAAFQIRMILIYKKGIKDTLTAKEKAVLRKINAAWR